jgi:transcription elongation factor Elf1
MKFVCPYCGGNSFFLHMAPDNNTLAQCTKCGKATRFEQSAMTIVKPPDETDSTQINGGGRRRLHLQVKS